MFDDLRRAFREAVDNFREELARDEVPGTVDRLLKGMIDEVTEAKARLADLDSQIERTDALLQKHRAEIETTLRRQRMAAEIEDQETAQVAADYAAKLQERSDILARKLAVLTEEATLLRGEVDSMMKQVKEARTRRDGLTAEAGRSGARDSIGASDDLFADFDRMESEIEDGSAEADAWAELGSEMGSQRSEFSIDLDAPTRRPDVDYDAALEELKRRMNRD